MINDSGVFVPHTRSFPGTSNLQHTLGILLAEPKNASVSITGLSLAQSIVLSVYVNA